MKNAIAKGEMAIGGHIIGSKLADLESDLQAIKEEVFQSKNVETIFFKNEMAVKSFVSR